MRHLKHEVAYTQVGFELHSYSHSFSAVQIFQHASACCVVCGPAGRFNERLVLSLASCPHCLLMDDELNVLPTSTLIRWGMGLC